MLGLAMRAGRLVLGTELIRSALPRQGKGAVELVVVSETASDSTKETLKKKCAFYGVRIIEVAIDMAELGRMLGKTYTPAAVAVTDGGLAREIARLAELPSADGDSV